jgi:hypothetical protein
LQAAGYTGLLQRLTRGKEDGGGRREAVGRGGEWRWMEGREGLDGAAVEEVVMW